MDLPIALHESITAQADRFPTDQSPLASQVMTYSWFYFADVAFERHWHSSAESDSGSKRLQWGWSVNCCRNQ